MSKTNQAQYKNVNKKHENYIKQVTIRPWCTVKNLFPSGEGHVYVKEDDAAAGTFGDDVLTGGMTYYLYVQQDPEQEKEDMAKMKALWGKAAAGGTLLGDDGNGNGGRGEGCSCLFGSPCVDKYVCLDWDNRMAVAKAHGMLPLAG